MRRTAIHGFTVLDDFLRVPDSDGRIAGRDVHTEKMLDLTLRTAILRSADESPGSPDETRNRSNPGEPNRRGLEK